MSTLPAIQKMPRSLFAPAPRLTFKTISQAGAKGMSFLPRRERARNTQPLPLFDWAELNAVGPFEPLLITRKLAGRLNISTTVLDAMAAANGFTAREVAND